MTFTPPLNFAAPRKCSGVHTSRVFQKYNFFRFVNGDKNVAVYGSYETKNK